MIEFNSKLLEKLCYFMRIKRYSERTIDSYASNLRQFFSFCDKQSKAISKQDFINYLQYITNNGCSRSKHEQFINAWKMYLKEIHGRELKYANQYRPRRDKKLPNVLSEEEILSGIEACENLKHKTILSVLFSTGMRKSEILNLKVKDINSKNMIIRIIGGKGFKDRNVPLTEPLLFLLRSYHRKYKPKLFLFEGVFGKYSQTSLSKIVRKYLDTNPHNIRHSRGTNLIENGADITDVQTYFGHKSVKTSSIYIHTSVSRLKQLHDPLKKVS